ncbi:hypothetical protein C5167_029993 [Papaver somniferum]|nr:hypothetical protein C5167_029993 [Papaver somniferum]
MVHELRSGFKFRAPPVRDLVERSSSINKYKNPGGLYMIRLDNLLIHKFQVLQDSRRGYVQNPCSDRKFKRPRVTHGQPGLPAKTEIASFPELDKEIRVQAPIARCPQNGKSSESCIPKDGAEQDIHVEEGCQPGLPSKTDIPVPPEVKKEGGSLKVSCHMDVKPARMIDNAISQVCARGQSVMAVQKELQREIKGIPRSQHSSGKDVLTRQQTFDSEEANLSPNNVVVCTKQQVSDSGEATESPGTEISRNISLVETIYLKRMKKLLSYQSMNCTQFKKDRDGVKEELIANLRKEHLLLSALVRTMHTQIQVRIAERKQKKLKTMLKAAKNEEKDLKYHWLQEAKSGRTVDVFSILPQFLYSYLNLDGLKNPSERLLLNSSNNANSVLPHALQIELPTAMDSVTEPVLTNESEGCTPLVVQLQSSLPTNAPSEPGNGTRVSENSRLCQPIKEENQKVCINTDFVDTASAQKKRAVGTSFNRDKVQLKVRGEPTPCSNVKLERKVDQTGLPVGTEDSSNVKVKLEKSLDPYDQFGVERTSHWWDPVTAPGLRVGSPANVICIPADLDVICISDDDT